MKEFEENGCFIVKDAPTKETLRQAMFVVNQVCASSAGGSFYNGLAPTNGTWGHNSISENIDYKHLINVSRIAYFMYDNHVPSDEELWSL